LTPHDPGGRLGDALCIESLRDLSCAELAGALLRYNVLEGLNIEEIGKIYGVHRATVARWITAARESILGRTRDELERRFGITAVEIDSIVRLVQSRLDVSMERVLR
jgi:RNA polymerase sigma-70 factor, ECF subfamily